MRNQELLKCFLRKSPSSNAGVPSGAPAYIEIINFPSLSAGITYNLKVAQIRNPNIIGSVSLNIGVKVLKEIISTGVRSYSHY